LKDLEAEFTNLPTKVSMDNQSPFNRDLIIPIIIGGISVIGIIAALLIGRSLSSPAEVPLTPSSTPFEFIFLGTEPAITTPLVEGSAIATLPEDSFEPNPVVPSPAPNRTVTSTALVLRTNTPGGSPTSNSGGLPTSTVASGAVADTYDDTNPRFEYSGNWISQSNVTGAYQGTLHISSTIGDSVTFTFTGDEIHLFYQAGPSLGTLAITIDGAGPPPFSLAQSETQIREWVYELDTSGTHSIVIQHFSGGSVNIDSLRVPGGPTPTPTRTPTPTP
jgi:hypothetical protein